MKTYIKGFEESNLQQINAFVFEVDSKDLSAGEIILKCEDLGLGIPTMIVETDRGFHIYFALTKPMFIDSKTNFKALLVAKRITNNIKNALFKEIGADFNCNSFGFFRMPTKHNVVWYSENLTYNVQRFMAWSMQYEDDQAINYIIDDIRDIKMNRTSINLEWIVPLLNNDKIKGDKGQLGRNNIMFTLALTCLKNGKTSDEA
ncbi:replication initiation protein, partial [Lysinibacillus sp. UGB7]